MKKIFLIILMPIVLLGFVGCGKQNELVEESAQKTVDAFANGDLEAINELVFGTEVIDVDDELTEIWEEDIPKQEGVLSDIFNLVTVEVKKITKNTIEYKIEAPDMSNIFLDIDTENLSENEMAEQIRTYALNAKIKKTTVSLDYVLVDGEPIINYQDADFINAVTGGLLDAYKTLYSEMMEEYAKGVNLE